MAALANRDLSPPAMPLASRHPSPSVESLATMPWHRQWIARVRVDFWLKGIGITAFIWGFFLAYFWLLPKVAGAEQIRVLASELYEIEQKLGLKHNSTKIVPQVGETAHAALTLGDLVRDRQPRLSGFAWNAENVARGLGAKRTRCEDGRWTDALAHVRAMTLMLARSIGVVAIDTATGDFRNVEQGKRDARHAKHDGFHGMFAAHPRQVAAIHEAYALSAKERAEAEAVIGLANSRSITDLLAESDAAESGTDGPAVHSDFEQLKALRKLA